MGGSRVSADTDRVRQGGQRTAGTADGWKTIGSDTKTALGNAHDAIKDDASGLMGAIESFGTDWVPKITKMGTDVSNLGHNATGSANAVDANDARGANTQTAPTTTRPINVR